MTAALEETRPRETLPRPEAASTKQKRVVIIGGGFAGIAAARALRRCDADVVLIDRRNHHIFQPLLYQVGDRGSRTRRDRRADSSDRGEAEESHGDAGRSHGRRFELRARSTCPTRRPEAHRDRVRFLIIAAGMQSSYFGHDEFARYAPGLKNLSDAETIRTRILSAYELARTDRRRKRALSADDFRAGWRRPHRRGAGSLDGADGHGHAARKLSPHRSRENFHCSDRGRQSYSADVRRDPCPGKPPDGSKARRQSSDGNEGRKVDEQGVARRRKRIRERDGLVDGRRRGFAGREDARRPDRPSRKAAGRSVPDGAGRQRRFRRG